LASQGVFFEDLKQMRPRDMLVKMKENQGIELLVKIQFQFLVFSCLKGRHAFYKGLNRSRQLRK
jgi:hypothetical protein